MFGIEFPPGTIEAASIVGVVLVQALVLYAGYGGVVSVVGPTVAAMIGAEP